LSNDSVPSPAPAWNDGSRRAVRGRTGRVFLGKHRIGDLRPPWGFSLRSWCTPLTCAELPLRFGNVFQPTKGMASSSDFSPGADRLIDQPWMSWERGRVPLILLRPSSGKAHAFADGRGSRSRQQRVSHRDDYEQSARGIATSSRYLHRYRWSTDQCSQVSPPMWLRSPLPSACRQVVEYIKASLLQWRGQPPGSHPLVDIVGPLVFNDLERIAQTVGIPSILPGTYPPKIEAPATRPSLRPCTELRSPSVNRRHWPVPTAPASAALL